MKQQFFTDTIQSKFIKSLLYNTALPKYNTARESSFETRKVVNPETGVIEDKEVAIHGTYLIKGYNYVHHNSIIYCTASGYLGESAMYEASSNPYNHVSEYFFGEYNPKISERYTSKYNYYDSDTHVWLGRYLRYYRDIFGLDLMRYYNCFANTYTDGFDVNLTTGVFNTTHTKKVAKIPIKFNSKYTIALDCSGQFKIAPVLLNKYGIVSTTTSNDENAVSLNTALYNCFKLKNNVSYDSATFKHCISVDTNLSIIDDEVAQKLFQYERDLYLLIILPPTINTSIVVLEGDYKSYTPHNVINFEDIDDVSSTVITNLCISDLELLQMGTKTSYPFSDKLIEILLGNVISSRDPISNNISKVEKQLPKVYPASFYDGVWDNYLQGQLYNFYMNDNSYRHLDVDGLVDKRVEMVLQRKGFGV